MQLPLPSAVCSVLDAIRAAGGRPLVVGGAVRDAAYGLDPKDFDIEVYGLPLDPLRDALARVGTLHQVGKSFGVIKVAVDGVDVDVALPRRESKQGRGHRGFLVEPDPHMTPGEAALRRDFTINAMAWDPEDGELLDFFGGIPDLAAKSLRHVGPRFADDPLRVLRGVQMAGRFDLDAAGDTVELSRGLLSEYDTLAVERVWAEWWKWATKSRRPSSGLRFLRDCGWWDVYPELRALSGCPQDPDWHPEGDVWVHTLLVSDGAAAIATRDALADEDRGVLCLAALCHDLGKPGTTEERDGRIRSPGHAEHEASYTAFLERIGCPRKIAERVVALCRHHLAHVSFAGSARHVRRLARSLGERGETIEMLARLVESDHGGRPPLDGGMPAPMAGMLEVARRLSAAAAAPRPLLAGRDLLQLGMKPGPEMGRILREAYEAQLDGLFDDRDGAIAWVRESES